MKKKTLLISQDLHTRLKEHCKTRGLKVQVVADDAIAAYLTGSRKKKD